MSSQEITREIGDLRVTVRKLRPRQSLVTLAHLARVVGPTLSEIVASGGIRVGDRFISLRQAASAALAPGDASEELAALVRGFFAQMIDTIEAVDPVGLVSMVDHLLAGHTRLARADGLPWVTDGNDHGPTYMEIADDPELAGKMLDRHVPDVWTLLGIVKAAIEVNYLPSSPGERAAATSGDGSQARAKAKKRGA